MMGGSTPNIDRIGDEGMIFMDHYAQASCTAGRAAFITFGKNHLGDRDEHLPTNQIVLLGTILRPPHER